MITRNRLRPNPALPTLAWLLTLAFVAPLQPAAAQDTARHPGQEGLPLRPDRYLEFTAREGTWISLDVSADGREIVFDLLGDIYLMPITGGAARPLTHGMGVAAMPRFSPDGQRVVFVSDRDGGNNVWILSTDLRDTVQVTRGKTSSYESPVFTPDGDYVVVTRANKLHMYHVQGGSGVQLIREPTNLRTMGAAFGADDRWIWYAQRVGTSTYNSPGSDWSLAAFDRETGQAFTRASRFGGAFRPTLSPDGRWLVYGTRHIAETALRIRDLQTGEERWLAYPVHRDEQESQASNDVYPGMAFTPDSRHLVATYGGRIWRIPVDGGDATEIPFEAPVRIPMAPRVAFEYELEDTPTFAARQIRDAVPSPDGQRLAFSAMGRLHLTDWPDGTPRRVSTGSLNEHQPAWSHDGQWIAYTTWSHAEGGHIWRVRADGRQPPQRLTTTSALYEQLAFSPAGDRIVALRGSATVFRDALDMFAFPVDIVWIPAAGGAATEIAPVRGRSNPHFTNDPDRIFFRGQGGVTSMRWDGTDERVHVRVTSGAGTGGDAADWVRMSPDGTRVLAQVGLDLFVVTVPLTGAPPTIGVGSPEGAPFPVRRLTDIGGEFPAWSGDGRRVHWSIGNAHIVYDLDRAHAFEDSVRAASQARGQQARYEPLERRVEVVVERDVPVGEIVLRGGRAITMRGDEIIEDADVIVRGNRIVAIGARGSVQHAPDAQIIDVAGKTVLPGFVDTHAHRLPSVFIHRDQVWSYAANLAYGVTTTRNPQTARTDVLSYADRVDAGEILGPRIFSTGPGISARHQIRDLAHARRVLRRYSDYYGTNTIKQYTAGNREQRQWIIQAARELRLMPTTEGAADFRMGIQEAIDGYSGHEHTWTAFPSYPDLFRLFADAQIYYTPTILIAYGGPWAENHFFATEDVLGDRKLRTFTPFQEIERKALRRGGSGRGAGAWFHPDVHVFRQIGEQVKGLLDHGGVAAVGSHGQLQGLGYHWEVWAMQSGGLDEHKALRAATLMGAQAIGHARDLGSLEPGKLADIVVLDRNPLEDIRNTNTVRFVMKNGRLYDGDTLDEIAPRQRRNGPFYWADYEPTGVRAGERR